MCDLLRVQYMLFLKCLTGLVLLGVVTFCGHAVAAPLCKKAPLPLNERLSRVWQENSEDLWFYNAAGKRVIPTIDEDWVAIRFNSVKSGMGMPENIRAFNKRFAEELSEVVSNPSWPDLVFYHLNPTHGKRLIKAVINGVDPTIRYLLPAFIYGNKTVVLGERITVRWKSQLDSEHRCQLLHSIGAVNYPADFSGCTEVVQIDPRRMAVWKASNLLAEDVQVVTASPELLPVEVPVKVSFQLAGNGTVAGAALPFSLTINFTDRVKIEPGTIANLNLKPLGISRNLFNIDYDTALSIVDVRHSPIQICGNIYLYSSGQFELPAISVFYRNIDSTGGQLHRVISPPVKVRIASLVPDGKEDYRLQVPASITMVDVDHEVTAVPHSLVWRMLIAGVILVIGVGMILRRRFQQPQDVVQIVQPSTAHVLCQVIAVARRNRDSRGLAEVGLELRRYLIEWADVTDASLGGGSRLFCRRLSQRVPDKWSGEIQSLLQQVENYLSQEEGHAPMQPLLDRIEQLVMTLEKQRLVKVAGADVEL